jgi:hypothetical protein
MHVRPQGHAYLALMLGRAAAFALFMLRANASRKRRSRGARALRRLNTLRKALSGWRRRLVLSGRLQEDLGLVFHKVGTGGWSWGKWMTIGEFLSNLSLHF